MYGSDADIVVMSLPEYQLACHMKEPEPLDLGNFVLSPMPGTLISFAVKVCAGVIHYVLFFLPPYSYE